MAIQRFANNIEFQLENFSDFEFYSGNLRFAPGGGVVIYQNELEGVLKFAVSASWWSGIDSLTIDCHPVADDTETGKATFLIKYNNEYYGYDSTLQTPAWVAEAVYADAVWTELVDLNKINVAGSPFVVNGAAPMEFEVFIKLSRTTTDEESPLLTRAAVLYKCNILNYGAYINKKLVNYLEGRSFMGRVTIKATSVAGTGGVHYIPAAQIPAFSTGYVGAALQAIYKSASPNVSIFGSIVGDKWYLTSGTTLSDEDVVCEFSYTLQAITNQALDLIQIEKFPVLIVSDLSQPIHLMPASEEVFFYPTDPVQSCLVATCPGIGEQGFNLEILTDLYYDALQIVNSFAHGTDLSSITPDYEATDPLHVFIDLPEIGQQMRLSVAGEPTETSFSGNSSGNKVFELRMKLVFPFPIPRLTVAKKLYSGWVLDSNLAGG